MDKFTPKQKREIRNAYHTALEAFVMSVFDHPLLIELPEDLLNRLFDDLNIELFDIFENFVDDLNARIVDFEEEKDLE